MLNVDSIVALVFLLGAAQGTFLAFALFTSKSGPRRANVYLGAYTLLFSVALFDYFLDEIGVTQRYIQLTTLLWPKEFLYGVLIYFYTRELIHPAEHVLIGKQWLHFLPALIHLVVTWPLLLFDPAFQVLVLTQAASENLGARIWGVVLGDIEFVLSALHIATYIVLTLVLLFHHRNKIKNHFSYTDKICLDWLRNLLIGTLAIYISWLLSVAVEAFNVNSSWVSNWLGLSMVILIYAMGYMGLRQPKVFSDRSEGFVECLEEQVSIDVPQAEIDSGKYRNSALSEDLGEVLMNDLLSRMDDEKLYLQSQLSLPQLADTLGLSVNYVSQIINQHHGENFFDFVNGFRVEEACRLFKDNTDRPILDVALMSGFNSKSAFYTAFKKKKGMTPGQYKKTQL